MLNKYRTFSVSQQTEGFNNGRAHQKISIERDDTALLDVLTEVINKVGNISPALKSIGEGLTLSTRDRMENQIAPDGSSWEPLSGQILKLKKKKGLSDKTLIGKG